MSENAFHINSEQLRNQESRESKFHGGEVPRDSDISAVKQMVSEQESKSNQIDRVKANLPLPKDPPGPPPPMEHGSTTTLDGSKTNVGSGGVNVKLATGKPGTDEGLREPAGKESSVRYAGAPFDKGAAPRNEKADLSQVKTPGNYKDLNARNSDEPDFASG